MKRKQFRPAVAMIELIFAIVVMGIVLMSAPMLIGSATQSSFVAIQQEAINITASHINMVMGYHWDENDADETYLAPILGTAGAATLNENGTTGRRRGTPPQASRSFLREDGTRLNATAYNQLGTDGAGESEDDIDDFIGNLALTQIESATTDTVEKTTDININTTVSYMTDAITSLGDTYRDPGADKQLTYSPNVTVAALATTSNIKHITATLTDTTNVVELNKTIVLHAFVCNIGSFEPAKKAF